MRRVNKIQILIGGAALVLGCLYYLSYRPPDQTYFLFRGKIPISLYPAFPIALGNIGGSLPGFFHVFSLILISAGMTACGKKHAPVVCLVWFFIDGAFELGQKYHAVALRAIPGWFEGIPFFENSANYFIRGTFDPLDLVGVGTGSVVACFVLFYTMQTRDAR